mgnify:CR=1 FL=1
MENLQTYDEILNYIVYKSREKDNPVSNAFVAFLLNIQYDKQAGKFYFEDEKLSKEKAEEVIEKVQKLLDDKGDIIKETLLLQVTYELCHIKEEDKIEKTNSEDDKQLKQSKISNKIFKKKKVSKEG